MRKFAAKFIATLSVASLALIAPTFTPVITTPASALVSCGVVPPPPPPPPLTQGTLTWGSAFAAQAIPCPLPHQMALNPAPVFVLFGGVASVMLNAAWVWKTQCRELTSQEAETSTFLPLIGIFFDKQASQCHLN